MVRMVWCGALLLSSTIGLSCLYAQVASDVISVKPEGSPERFNSTTSFAVSASGMQVVYDDGRDLWFRDLRNGVTRALTGPTPPGGSRTSSEPDISGDGRWVVYEQPNVVNTIALVDTRTGVSRVIARRRDGSIAWAYQPTISGDGRMAAFSGPRNLLAGGDWDFSAEALYVTDLGSGVTRKLIESADVRYPLLSGDGTVIAYNTWGAGEWYVHAFDLKTNASTPVSRYPNGASGPGFLRGIDHAGLRISYGSGYAMVSGDTNNRSDVFVFDRNGSRTRRVSVGLGSRQLSGHSHAGRRSLSGDGRYQAFSTTDGVFAGDTNGRHDVYVIDLLLGASNEVVRRTFHADGSQPRDDAIAPAIAAGDSRIVVFHIDGTFEDPHTDLRWPNRALVATDYSWRPFAAKINFQPIGKPEPDLHLIDLGRVFGERGDGFAYGWRTSHASAVRDRDSTRSPDQRYDTLIRMQNGDPQGIWELRVPNGWYDVRLVAGDPSFFEGRIRIAAENVLAIDYVPSSAQPWLDRTVRVRVVDGRLTLSALVGTTVNKICFAEVSTANP